MDDRTPRRIKVACPGCGQKLDVTELTPFSRVKCPACSFEIIVPRWFNNYLLEAPEGAGGMAVVYRALDIALDREVAIKVFNPDLASKGVSQGLFLQEARIAATLNHPAVVPIYSCGECDGSAYIVMQYMGGGSLEQRLLKARGRLPMMETCRWIRDVCEGLSNAREHGIVHHDVKPANILLDLDSNAKISDFGLAQAASVKASAAFLDPSKMWLSPNYVSPEKVLTGEEGPEGDIYSLGASFYHLLSGETPFRSDDIQELLRMRTERDPVSPDRVRPEITAALASVILDMMSRDPAARPSYAQIVVRINDAVRAITRPAAPPGSEPAAKPVPPSQERPRKVLKVPADRTGKRRRPFRSSRVGLLLFLLFINCAVCAFVFLPNFVDKRALLDAAPALKAIYGDLPPESFPFLSDPSFLESPLLDADAAFSNYENALETRYAAAWISGMCRLLDDVPSAVSTISDMGEHLGSCARIDQKRIPRADAYCLDVLCRPGMTPPNVYFSQEQLTRVLLGRLIRSLYDLESASVGNARVPDRVLTQFGEVRAAFRALPEDSWLVKLYGPRLRAWEAFLVGDPVSPDELEPVFRRLLSGANPDAAQGDRPAGSGSIITGSPFGVESPVLPPQD